MKANLNLKFNYGESIEVFFGNGESDHGYYIAHDNIYLYYSYVFNPNETILDYMSKCIIVRLDHIDSIEGMEVLF